MNLNSAKFGQFEVDDVAFASGGAGRLHRTNTVNSGTSTCVKLLVAAKSDDFDKIRHMVDCPPATCISGWGQLCWPMDIVMSPLAGSPVGYIMAMAESGSVELSNLTGLRWPARTKSALSHKLDRCTSEGMTRRMLIGCNIAAAVQEVHRMGCVFVDLKPQNVLISEQGAVSLVDLDSLQVGTATKTYHGPLGSPEYMPPESYGMDFSANPLISTTWDQFSLAVIIYELLFGIHPFTASANPAYVTCETIDESIRFGMYVHGKNRVNLSTIPAPHESLKEVPEEVAGLFNRAFDLTDPTSRPTSQEWGEALKRAVHSRPRALSSAIYAQRQPNFSKVTAGSVQGAGSLAPFSKVCVGEPLGACPGQPNGQTNPATFSLVGMSYCAGCYARKTGISLPSRSSPCHGQYGMSCPYECEKTPRVGLHAATLSDGKMVHLCDHCFNAHSGRPNPNHAPKVPLKYERKSEDELWAFIKEWGPLAAIVGISGYFLYLKYNKNKKRP